MQIQKVQSNQTTFGTKVKMNPRFITNATQSGEYKRLREQIKVLENNGFDDILSINQIYVQRTKEDGTRDFISKVYAEVYKISRNKLIKSNAVESNTYEFGPRGAYHFPNIVNLYNQAKESLKDYGYGINISKWIDYI